MALRHELAALESISVDEKPEGTADDAHYRGKTEGLADGFDRPSWEALGLTEGGDKTG